MQLLLVRLLAAVGEAVGRVHAVRGEEVAHLLRGGRLGQLVGEQLLRGLLVGRLQLGELRIDHHLVRGRQPRPGCREGLRPQLGRGVGVAQLHPHHGSQGRERRAGAVFELSELDVTDLDISLGFYVGVVGFTVVFERQRLRVRSRPLVHTKRDGCSRERRGVRTHPSADHT